MSNIKNYILNPNLPQKNVCTVITDYRTPKKVINKLAELQINVLPTTSVDTLYNAVRGHADLQIHHIYNNTFVCAAECYNYYKTILPDCELIQGTSFLASNYPQDIAYNVARIDKIAFHNLKYTDYKIAEYYEKLNIKLVNVKQGYAKCNVCIAGKNAIITSDKSIAKAADNYNIDVLFISQGYIDLIDFPYGFIGGASGLIAPDKLAFTGNIKLHHDYDKIAEFCEVYNVALMSLSDDKLVDVGSLLPICI